MLITVTDVHDTTYLVMRGDGFNVADSVSIMDASLDLPAFAKGREQLRAREIESMRKIANVRIHIESLEQLVRQKFTIISAIEVLSKHLVQIKINDGVLSDSVARVCCVLNNLCEGVVPFV